MNDFISEESYNEALAAYNEAYNEALAAFVSEASAAAIEAATEAATEAVTEAEEEIEEAYLQDLQESWEYMYSILSEEAIAQLKANGIYIYCNDVEDGLIDIIMEDIVVTGEYTGADAIFNDAYSEAYQAAMDEILSSFEVDFTLEGFLEEAEQEELENKFNTDDLDEEQKEALYNVMNKMKEDCFYKSLLGGIGGQKIKVDPSGSYPGYNPSTNEITLLSNDNFNSFHLAAEMFHAYQQELYGNLDDIQTSADHTGGSNIEFEEKVMMIIHSFVFGNPSAGFPDTEGVPNWILQLLDDNGGKFPTEFNDEQQEQYLEFVRAFQEYNAGKLGMYGAPVDESMSSPNVVLDILNNSDCDF